MKNREQTLQKISIINLIINLFLGIFKIIGGLSWNSKVLVADGVDSLGDSVIALTLVIASIILQKQPDYKFPYGRNRVETVASKILAILLIFNGLQILSFSINSLFTETIKPTNSLAAYIALTSFFVKGFLASISFKAGKKLKSSMLHSNSINMLQDMLSSFIIFLQIIISFFFNIPWLDPILAIILSLVIIYNGIKLTLETAKELMDGTVHKEVYKKILDIINNHPFVNKPHRLRIRKLAHYYIIEFDIEVNGNTTVYKSHTYCVELEQEIRKQLDNVYDIMIHVEPQYNKEENEPYGVSDKDFKGD